MSETAVLALYIALTALPGLAVALVSGLRGWTAAAAAPLVSYGVVVAAGTACTLFGWRWSLNAVIVATVIAIVAAAAIRAVSALVKRRLGITVTEDADLPGRWQGWRGLAVLGVTAACAAIGLLMMYVATADLQGIPQGWDANFHANVVRFIADTGNADPAALAAIHYYDDPVGFYYPNGFHLFASIVYELTGAPVATVLDAATAVIPPILTVGLVGMLRRFRVRPALAASVALLSISVQALPYDLIWRGPLLPNALGLALVPAFITLLHTALADRSIPAIALVPVGAGALVAIHPSNAFVAAIYGAAFIAERWLLSRKVIKVDLVLLAVAGVGAIAFSMPAVLGSISNAANEPIFTWAADLPFPHALGDLVMFSHGSDFPRIWMTGLLIVGVANIRKLRQQWWLLAASGLFAIFFLLAAGYQRDWIAALTRPWWNDRWRLIAAAAPGLMLLTAQGLVSIVDWTRRRLPVLVETRLPARVPERVAVRARSLAGTAGGWLRRPLVAPALVVLVLLVLTNGMYAGTNLNRVSRFYEGWPAVTPNEQAAYEELGKLVPKGAMVMNQGTDGSAWMYAIAGVKPVNGHADQTKLGPRQKLLQAKFNRLDTNPEVQQVVADMNIRYVIVGEGFLGGITRRDPGLRDLDKVRSLTLVYENRDARIYEITSPDGVQPSAG
jgi:hypothetical protein